MLEQITIITVDKCKNCYFLEKVDLEKQVGYCSLYFRIHDDAPDFYIRDGLWEECPLKKCVLFKTV